MILRYRSLFMKTNIKLVDKVIHMRAALLRLISRATNLNVEVNKAKKRARKLNCQNIPHISHVIFRYDLQHKHDKIRKRIFNSELNIDIFRNASFMKSREHNKLHK